MNTQADRIHMPKNTRLLISMAAMVFLCVLILSNCTSTGACVGAGGDILISPVCKNVWTRGECQEWSDMGVNGAEWKYMGEIRVKIWGTPTAAPMGASAYLVIVNHRCIDDPDNNPDGWEIQMHIPSGRP